MKKGAFYRAGSEIKDTSFSSPCVHPWLSLGSALPYWRGRSNTKDACVVHASCLSFSKRKKKTEFHRYDRWNWNLGGRWAGAIFARSPCFCYHVYYVWVTVCWSISGTCLWPQDKTGLHVERLLSGSHNSQLSMIHRVTIQPWNSCLLRLFFSGGGGFPPFDQSTK